MATSSANMATLEATLEARATLAVTPASVEVTPPVFTKEQQQKFAEKEALHAEIEQNKKEMLFYYDAFVEEFFSLETDEERDTLNYQAKNCLRAMQSKFYFMQSRLDTIGTLGARFSEDFDFLPKGTRYSNFEPEDKAKSCLLYTSPSPRDRTRSRMPSSA